MDPHKLFRDRNALLVTQHGKEQVISPLLEESFGMKMGLASQIDTDQFGTFSGEIERPDSQHNTARMKALKVFETYPDIEIAVASEGSFNPHPDTPFIPVNRETVMLLDRKNNLEIMGSYLNLAARIREGIVSSMGEAVSFAETIGFPEYGVILKANRNGGLRPYFMKDITTNNALLAAIDFLFSISLDGKIHIQSDMRAHRNPARMENIRQATLNLIKTIQSVCPICGTIGFDVKEVIIGLPCRICGNSTKSTLSYIFQCKKCNHLEEKLFPHGKEQEEPGFCDSCNP